MKKMATFLYDRDNKQNNKTQYLYVSEKIVSSKV